MRVNDLVGNTPLIELKRLSPKGRKVFGKAEYLNPGGSVKDRIGFFMIEKALERGELKEGQPVIEPTAGNTGIALALACCFYGIKMIAVMPGRFSKEKEKIIVALGGKVVRTPTSEGIEGAIEKAEQLKKELNGWVPLQFSNPDNAQAHFETTAPEIDSQLKNIDAFVAGIGSAGTFVGVSRFLKKVNKNIKCIAVQPEGSVLLGGNPGPHKVEGIGVDDMGTIKLWEECLCDEIITVSDKDAHLVTKRLASEEGLLVGASSGALVFAALSVAKKLPEGSNVVTLLCDSSERYISKNIYSSFEDWEK